MSAPDDRRIDRRRFNSLVGGVAGAGAALGAPFTVLGQGRAKVIVIGGGAGGGTAARYLARGGSVDVTLVEASPTYTTCFFSNLYLGGLRTYESITHRYDRLQSRHGITVVPARAAAVDAERRVVVLPDGTKLSYDRLVVAPGIDFRWDTIEGYDPAAAQVMPHAYRAGAQTRLLRAQLEAMPDGGLFVIAPPPAPYRCPPGPYERASMAAHYFKHHKPGAKILILDAKNEHSKQSLFQDAWQQFYPGMIEWLPADMTGGGVRSVDTSAMTVATEDETFTVTVANIIPAQKAGTIAAAAGLTDDTGWCPVHPATMASRRVPGVHVLGDAISAGEMPKSAFSANSQAKVCANAILADLAGASRAPARFRNTCWSLVASDNGIKVGADYEIRDGNIVKRDGFVSDIGEDAAIRATTAREADGWYLGITSDIFG